MIRAVELMDEGSLIASGGATGRRWRARFELAAGPTNKENAAKLKSGDDRMKEAVILAGGRGTRLRRVLPALPKPMAPVAGRPFLEIVLASLSKKGFRRVVLSVGYMSDKIIGHFGHQFSGMELVYEAERLPLGTGGGVRLALTRCREDYALVLNGDTFLDFDAAGLETLWQRERMPVIVACEMPDTTRYGRIETRNGRVFSLTEKGMSGPGLINAGHYLLPTDILDQFPPDLSFSLETDFLAKAVSRSLFCAFVSKNKFIEIGTPEDYVRAQIEISGLKK